MKDGCASTSVFVAALGMFYENFYRDEQSVIVSLRGFMGFDWRLTVSLTNSSVS